MIAELLQHIHNRSLDIRKQVEQLISGNGKVHTKNRDDGGNLQKEGFSQYEMRLPHSQNAIDSLPGWSSMFPLELGLVGGAVPLFQDSRILSALDAYGSIEGKKILEVGPLEGMHTYILNQHRPSVIDAIEANKACFLRCLVTKEILKLDRASFQLGDIQKWLQETDGDYDFALASGVLYHMPDPGEFLRLLSTRANGLFIWTHFYDEAAMPPSDYRRGPFSGKVEIRSVAGMDIRYHERSYQHAEKNASFCGGMKDRHYWLQRDEILSLLTHLGYNEVVVQSEELDHPGGPCFSVFARR